MRLQSIELTNFRQFKDEKIQFAIDKNQNVTLIMGDNGSGKTSLAQAFFWCFYGTNSFQDKILLNRFVANNMIPNQKEMVCVRVYLEHKQEEYCVVRQQEYTKQYNDSLKPQNSILAISKKDKNGNQFAYLDLYTPYGIIEATIWSSQLKEYSDYIKKGSCLAILGRKREEHFFVEKIKTYNMWLEQMRKKGAKV